MSRSRLFRSRSLRRSRSFFPAEASDMEKMPYRQELDTHVFQEPAGPVVSSDWQSALPALTGKTVTLRGLRPSDAASLFALLTTEEVSRFISPPPSTVQGFEA